ncbi:putative pectinesterase inhibitor domain-containing protein [Helianthus annuus]|uniref:uncharacterized protein LOC110927473 n=1 Tax=Helianthus annuus TaxID=4232 RepID=UPI000B8FB458|nr:uncharacterized protein LOC110927473 [Helianthus annuus]KAJ0495678.1 putative pectinesterase inhibitor domain-containing protein [Helianthus annuus]KAJ0933646.1 putative pectinesterase inhibitor domain-containing protein [Helianthus annuus]
MALTKNTLTTFLSIFALLFFALCSNAHPSPSPSPSSSPSTPPSDEPTDDTSADSPMSLSELFELALPEIGVQKKAATSETEGSKVASKQLEALELKISDFKPVLQKQLEDPNTSKPVKNCLSQCQENFASAIEGVKKSIESIRKQDLAKANIDISAISTNVDTCNSCFVDMKAEDLEIKAVNDWVQGVTGDCLASLKKT